MQIRPILAALRRHKAGTILIAVQIALTLAIVCNALFIVHERVDRVNRLTGIEEANLIAVQNRYVGAPATFIPQVKADVEALRSMADVEDAYATNSIPLRQSGSSRTLQTDPEATRNGVGTALYNADDHMLKTLGIHLIAGRNFLPGEVLVSRRNDESVPAQLIVTKALADKLFPKGDALGKSVYFYQGKPSTIVGIVARLTTPWIDSEFPEHSAILPTLGDSSSQLFVVRARPGREDAVFKNIASVLYKADRMRVIPDKGGVRTFAMVRSRAYEADRGMAILMSVVCAVLLAITAAGIVGLSSFWVGQRRKQIGTRRALGATRGDILSYFMTENFLIALGGVVVGTVLALALSQWMVTHFEMRRLSLSYIVIGVVVLLGLGQAAVFAPALRASRVSPVEATRSV